MRHFPDSLAAATAKTILIDKRRCRIYNDGSAKVYGKLNWQTGAVEVAATSFDFMIGIGLSEEFDFSDLSGNVGGITNVRLISSATANLGIVAW